MDTRPELAEGPWDVIVIGAGFSGLAAGIRCAQFFRRVLILEAHHVPGGLNSYYYRAGGRHLFSSGLHTVTNFRAGNRRWGSGLVFRNLGLKPEDFALQPPRFPSRIVIREDELAFGNDPQILEQSVADRFPGCVAGYRASVEAIEAESVRPTPTARDGLDLLGAIPSRRLRDLLALPVLCYGGYTEGTIDSRTFAVLFRSVLLEGCGCPRDIRVILDRLVAHFLALGGTLACGAAVSGIRSEGEMATGVVLTDGAELRAAHIISSVGLWETGKLAGHEWGVPGDISLFHWTGLYDRPMAGLGVRDALLFASTQETLDWRLPRTRPFTEVVSFSALDNYAFDPPPDRGHLKASFFSHRDEWTGLDQKRYEERKAQYAELLRQRTEACYPSLSAHRPTLEDAFTPLTLGRYTGHPNGTLYGGRVKTFDGRCGLRNLHVVGNDQGGIGIMGALTSGIVVTNYNLLL